MQDIINCETKIKENATAGRTEAFACNYDDDGQARFNTQSKPKIITDFNPKGTFDPPALPPLVLSPPPFDAQFRGFEKIRRPEVSGPGDCESRSSQRGGVGRMGVSGSR